MKVVMAGTYWFSDAADSAVRAAAGMVLAGAAAPGAGAVGAGWAHVVVAIEHAAAPVKTNAARRAFITGLSPQVQV
jgi:hypothetical protein